MLREFTGVIDSEGLRSFRQRSECEHSACGPAEFGYPHVPFWAVVETTTATCIIRELLAGSRKRALRLLEESAIAIGSSGKIDW